MATVVSEPVAFSVAVAVAVTGQTVVLTATTTVVTNVDREFAGQSVTVLGQAVMVAVLVEKTVDVVKDASLEEEELAETVLWLVLADDWPAEADDDFTAEEDAEGPDWTREETAEDATLNEVDDAIVDEATELVAEWTVELVMGELAEEADTTKDADEDDTVNETAEEASEETLDETADEAADETTDEDKTELLED